MKVINVYNLQLQFDSGRYAGSKEQQAKEVIDAVNDILVSGADSVSNAALIHNLPDGIEEVDDTE